MTQSASTVGARSPLVNWFGRRPWLILLVGVLVALLAAALLMYVLMAPPPADLTRLVVTLAMMSVSSVGLGYFIYRRGWARSSSLMLTLMLTYLWAAAVTLATVWVLQRQMFFSEHDLVLSGILLLFAAIIATTYGLFVAASVTDGLRRLADAAGALAAGDVATRVVVSGRDEVARLSLAFNEMASRLQSVARQREELDTMRRNLIAWVSHDLRTPLTAIRVRVEALDDGLVVDPVEVHRYYKAIRADAVALGKLIDDLFELAQLDAGGLQAAIAPHNLGDVVSDCLERFHAAADQRNVTLSGEVTPDVEPVAMDPDKISRVLNNLVDNALRYSPTGGTVDIRARREPDGVLVSVEDSGPGFAEADLPFVFEQFYRGETARSRTTGGAGLGLSIAQAIIKTHSGRIWAENRDGGGGRVVFLLPD